MKYRGETGFLAKLYYLERKIRYKYNRSRWCRNYEYKAEDYNWQKITPITFKPYANTITEFDLSGMSTEEMVYTLATHHNELVHQYNHAIDLLNVEEEYLY
jgi:hypothetical protein